MKGLGWDMGCEGKGLEVGVGLRIPPTVLCCPKGARRLQAGVLEPRAQSWGPGEAPSQTGRGALRVAGGEGVPSQEALGRAPRTPDRASRSWAV